MNRNGVSSCANRMPFCLYHIPIELARTWRAHTFIDRHDGITGRSYEGTVDDWCINRYWYYFCSSRRTRWRCSTHEKRVSKHGFVDHRCSLRCVFLMYSTPVGKTLAFTRVDFMDPQGRTVAFGREFSAWHMCDIEFLLRYHSCRPHQIRCADAKP